MALREQLGEVDQRGLGVGELPLELREHRDDHRVGRERRSCLVEVHGLAASHRGGDRGVGRRVDLHAVGRIAICIERPQQHEYVAQHLVVVVLHFLQVLQSDRREAAVDSRRRDGADGQLVRALPDEQAHVLADREFEFTG